MERSCDTCGDVVFEKISEKYEDPFNIIKIKCLSGHEDEIIQYLPDKDKTCVECGNNPHNDISNLCSDCYNLTIQDMRKL